jgi:thiamine biosynthesis lipoprotein
MGTVVSIHVRPRGLPMVQTRSAVAQACDVLHRADDVFSLFRHDTPLARLCRGEIEVADCPPEVSDVIALCEQAKSASHGWFDPWKLPGGFDPTGLVKGWAAREAARVLQDAGIGAGMINAAGDITTFGAPWQRDAWRVGVRSPDCAELLTRVIELRGGAIATSGLYERGAHIWDVVGGCPAAGVVSATVCGPDLALADAFATGLVAAGSAGLDAVTAAGYQALLLLNGGESISTAGFPVPAAV